LKRQFIELLEKDLEFRYAVAGYLGLSEVLKRLDSIEESIKKLWENQNKLWENQNRLWEEVKALREGQDRLWENVNRLWENTNRLWENTNKLWEEVRALREGQERLWESVNKLWDSTNKLWENTNKLWENSNKLWENTNRLWEEVRSINVRLGRVERTLEKLTLDVEEEARIVIKYRLREMGYEVEVGPLVLPEVEVNIYGVTNDLCVVGEAKVRASSNAIDEINEKVELLKRFHPNRLRSRLLRVVYTCLAMPDLIERAEREGVWVLKATGDIVKLKA